MATGNLRYTGCTEDRCCVGGLHRAGPTCNTLPGRKTSPASTCNFENLLSFLARAGALRLLPARIWIGLSRLVISSLDEKMYEGCTWRAVRQEA